MITKGRIVTYRVTAEDAEKINRRRTTGASIAERMSGANPTWPTGAQAHIGNEVTEGQTFPAIVVNAFEDPPSAADAAVNLQVFLDGSDTYWATSVHEDQSKNPAAGTWSWPARV